MWKILRRAANKTEIKTFEEQLILDLNQTSSKLGVIITDVRHPILVTDFLSSYNLDDVKKRELIDYRTKFHFLGVQSDYHIRNIKINILVNNILSKITKPDYSENTIQHSVVYLIITHIRTIIPTCSGPHSRLKITGMTRKNHLFKNYNKLRGDYNRDCYSIFI